MSFLEKYSFVHSITTVRFEEREIVKERFYAEKMPIKFGMLMLTI